MSTVLLIRHGESQANAGKPTPCPIAVELTANGWRQAKEISDYLEVAKLQPDLIVTSPYLRTKQTASMTTLAFPGALEEEWPVKEFTYLSSWLKENSTIEDRRPYANGYWQISDPELVEGEGAESFAQFINRSFMCKIRLETSTFETIVVFSHEQFISAIVWLMMCENKVTPTSEEMRDYRRYLLKNSLPNGAIVQAKFRQGNGEWTFETITEHLSDLNGWAAPISVEKSLFKAAYIDEKEPVQELELATAHSGLYRLTADGYI